jgi:hypothetical protein
VFRNRPNPFRTASLQASQQVKRGFLPAPLARGHEGEGRFGFAIASRSVARVEGGQDDRHILMATTTSRVR